MMNPFEFVLALLFLIFGFVIIKHKLGIPDRNRSSRERDAVPESSHEAVQLREEVKQLKDRIKVLERITVEKENSLSAEIESLRDR
jgi:uncharacterized protein YlxW (UPF0749 family)